VFANQVAGYEGFYASIVYCYFASLGLDVTPKVSTNKGRIDLVLRFAGSINALSFFRSHLPSILHYQLSITHGFIQ
jgi:hypothetical protein